MPISSARVAFVLSLASLAGCQPRGAAQPPPASAAAPAPAGASTLASAPAPPPPPVFSGPAVEVPAGSRLVLRLDDTVDSGRMSPGQRFRASLEAALLDQSGKVIVPARTKVLGVILETQQAGRVAGKSEVSIAFTDLEIGGVLFPIQSQGVKAVGEGSGGDTARKVAAGALIGGALGGGDGAAKGAAVGGAAAILTRGKQVKIPSGTILELTLAAPVKVPGPEGSAGATGASGEAATSTAAPATAAAAATGAAPAAAPAAGTPATGAAASPASGEADKACVKKLMSNGFSADEALASCKKESKK